LTELFAELTAIPSAERESALFRACDGDIELRDELASLLRAHDVAAGPLDTDPIFTANDADQDEFVGLSGTLVGPYRLIRPIGEGGMGSVWLAERSDGMLKRTVALKRPHLIWTGSLSERMAQERDILAGLEHPNIARLYDAGVSPQGQPYLALEYVEGQDLLAYCDMRRAPLEERLDLFLQVCAAVTYAHAHLVVHRDLKPANIFVTANGQVKLLDFGIAKLLQPTVIGDATRTVHLSPAYAAPEQLTGLAITTATDVYALGVTLFQLLSGRLPWPVSGLPLAAAVRLLDEAPPRPSAIMTADAPLSARDLRGDLDAIVAKSLRREPKSRYPDARALADDLKRHLRREPVQARTGAHAYVLRRFLRRRWLPLSAAAAVFVALTVGVAVALWQAQRAQTEAGRATATKNFLVSLFRASDPRIAQEKRGEITAKQLLDLGSARIDTEFAAQPELQIELLGLTAQIYDDLADEERYASVQKRRIELARAHYGPSHPIVIEGLLAEADAACFRQNYAKAAELLKQTDALLKTSGQDRSLLRAMWWRTKARELGSVSDGQVDRRYALNQALTLYSTLAPLSNEYAAALNMASRDAADRGEHLQAKQLNEKALAVAEAAPERDDALIGVLLINLARKRENVGEFDAADTTYQRAETQTRNTVGEHHSSYWVTSAYHARMLHRRGQRERAHVLFAQMLKMIPPDWKANTADTWAREVYAECLTAEGRARDAIPLLEAAYHASLARPLYGYDVREVRRELGDAYDRADRPAEARTLLKASRDEYLAKEPPDSEYTLRIRERWARFLLDHSKPGSAEFADAEAELRVVLEQAADRFWIEPAQAHAGLARVAAGRGDTALALDESRLAVAALARVQGLYDVRLQPELWLVSSAVLLKSGDAAGARHWAEKALEASRQYDDPSADSIKQAGAAVRAAMATGAL
jgi:serine/threonine-protein kinase